MPRIVVLIVLLFTCAAAVRAQAPLPDPDPLRLRPGDAIRLQVGGEPELAGDYPVTEEGGALLPLIGLVRVAGRPFDEVRSEIVTGFDRELLSPGVVVTPVLRIAVLGEVRQPGLLPVDPTFTVADVLAAAGGLTPVANRRRIVLLRDGGSHRLSLDDPPTLLAQRLRPGDQVVVERQGWVRENISVLLGAGASVLAAAVTSLILR